MTRFRRAAWPLFLGVGFLASILPYAYPRYREVLSIASALRPLAIEERKRTLFGPWYAEAAFLHETVPADGAIDFVMLTPSARDIAVLAGAVLQPRDVRYFDGWESWESRTRATFLHDARAANAAPGPPPPIAPIVVAVDPAAIPHFRIVRAPQ
jgi:hypothetical protein